MKDDELTRAEELIDQLVDANAYPGKRDISVKIDLLDQLLWRLRVKRRHLENDIDYDVFNGGDLLVDEGVLHVSPNTKSGSPGPGTIPVRLQTRLLMFLLINHGKTNRVFDIIEQFIGRIWDGLSIEDFKRTRTGVIRCFTNTRFAAKTLRDYGLLKFTRKEAHKTWVLSLPGFIVASRVYLQRAWDLPPQRTAFSFHSDLHRDIWSAWHELGDYEAFVRQLSGICKPNTEVFRTFRGVLKKAHALLGDYWAILADSSLTQAERKKRGAALIAELEQMTDVGDFYREFVTCIEIEDIIRKSSYGE